MSILVSTARNVHPFAAPIAFLRTVRQTLLALLLGACLVAPVAAGLGAAQTRSTSSAGVHTSTMRPDVPCSGGLVTPC